MREYVFSSPIPQLLLSSDARILQWNQSFAALYVEGLDGLEGRHISDIVVPRNSNTYQQFLEELINTPGSASVISCRISIPGHVAKNWWFLSASRLENSGIHASFISAEQQIRETENLERDKHAAEEATKSKSLFLANMSHEIRTPIHTVRGMAELLMDTQLDQEQSEYASQIKFSAEALLGLINDILDFSKIEAGKLHIENIRYDVFELYASVLDMLSLEMYKRGLGIMLEIDDNMPQMISGDPTRMRQILVNLLSNAMKFTANGHISLHLKLVEINDNYVTFRTEVRDTGIGIPEEKQNQLFSSFQQVDATTTRKYGGTGLGLSICKNLVQLMGGTIGLQSREGNGTTFMFNLKVPYYPSQTHGELKQGLKILEDKSVLIVDKYLPSAQFLSRLISGYAKNVSYCTNGSEGLELLRKAEKEERSEPVVLVDLQLEDMDGWQFASEVNSDKLLNNSRLFLIRPPGTMQADAKMKLLNWFDGYLTKPLKTTQLAEQLTMALDTSLDLWEVDEIEPEELQPVDDTSLRILLAEDHFVNQQLFKTLLDKLGHEVTVANNGREMVSSYKADSFDLLFMDLQMPDMDGYSAAKLLREDGAMEPIIAVTANALMGEKKRCLNAGMDDYMSKPFGRDDLLNIINRWEGRSHNEPSPNSLLFNQAPQEDEHLDSKTPIDHSLDSEYEAETVNVTEHEPIQPWNETSEEKQIIDFNAAVKTFMGNEEVVLRILSEFLRRGQTQLEKIRGYVKDGKLKDARILSHGMKGSSRNMSMTELGNAAAKVEDACEEGDPEIVTALLPQLEQTFTRVRDYLEPELERKIADG